MSIKKIIKRTLIAAGVLLFLVLGAAVAIPYFFKDKILSKVKIEMNKKLNATVNFKDVGMTIFKDFPNITLSLQDFSVIGKNEFKDVKLVGMENFYLNFDFWSVVKQEKPLTIEGISLGKPEINVRVLANGKANYDIVKPDPNAKPDAPASSSDAFALKLKSVSIVNGAISYDDAQSGMNLNIDGLDNQTSGDFSEKEYALDTDTQIKTMAFGDDQSGTSLSLANLDCTFGGDIQGDKYDLSTNTKADKLSVSQGGIPYLNKAKAAIDLAMSIDNKTQKYTFKENDIRLNALRLIMEGWLQMKGKDIAMDMKFKSPSTDFKDLLSMIPAAYSKDFDDVKASGKMSLGGFAKGTYNANSMPAFAIDLTAQNANFQYPDLPMAVSDITADVHVKCPNQNFDLMTVDIPKIHWKLGANPFDATLKLRTPMSDPDIQTKVKGIINLADLQKAFPMEGVKTLSGIIDANVEANTRMSYINNSQYDKVDTKGNLGISAMKYKAENQPEVLIRNLKLGFSPQFVDIPAMDMQLGKSDVKGSGRVDNILAYFSKEKTMKGNLTVRSILLDVNEWTGGETTTTTKSKEPSAAQMSANQNIKANETEKPFDRFDFTIDGDLKKILYDKYELKNVIAKGNFQPNSFKIAQSSMTLGNSDMALSGTMDNVFGYLYDNKLLKGELNFKSTFFDLNQFMTPEGASTKPVGQPVDTSNLEPIEIPGNIDMTLASSIGTLLYENYRLTNVAGNVILRDHKASLQNLGMNTMGGRVAMNGTYDARTPTQPLFDFDYQLQNLSFTEVFKNVSSVQQFAPIMQYIDGNFSSAMKMKGSLGKDLMPNFNSLSGLGDLITTNGILRNFKPLDEIANQLNIKELKEMRVVGTKNFFEIVNGRFNVKPFDWMFKNINFNVGGSHSLTADMDYLLKAKIPMAMLTQNAAGAVATKGFGLLQGQASKIGVNLKQSEFANVNIKLLGSMKNPKVQMQLVNGEGKSVKDAVVDQAKEQVKAVVEDTKAKATEAATTIVKDTKEKATEIVKETTTKAKEEATKAVQDIVKGKPINQDSLKKAAEDLLKGAGTKGTGTVQDQVKAAKDNLDKLNPFKKKNK